MPSIIAGTLSTFFWTVPYSSPPSKWLQKMKSFCIPCLCSPSHILPKGRHLVVVRFKAQKLHAAIILPILNTRDKEKAEIEKEREFPRCKIFLIFNSLHSTVSKMQIPAAFYSMNSVKHLTTFTINFHFGLSQTKSDFWPLLSKVSLPVIHIISSTLIFYVSLEI